MIVMEVNMEHLERACTGLAALGRDMSPLTRDLAEVLKGGVDRAFADEEDPSTGEKWHPLSPATLARRKKAGHEGKILQVKGQLAASFHTEYGPHHAQVGTSDVRARTHQFGAKRGAYGTAKRGTPHGKAGVGRRNSRNYTSRGGATVGGWLSGRAQGGTLPVPWGDIPARPMLGVGAPEVAEIEDSVRRAVRRAVGVG